MLKSVESIVLFVADIEAAASWYAQILGVTVQHENEQYAFVQAPGVLVGFHPADEKNPGGAGSTTAYWEVDSIHEAVHDLVSRGARLHRGPSRTDFGAQAAMLIDPFGCTIGLIQSSPESLPRYLRELEESLLQPDVRKSRRLVALIADDFLEFGTFGRVYTKEDLVALLQAESPSIQTVSNFRVSLLAPSIALLTYVIRCEASPPSYTLRSSVWRLRGEQWQMTFHQSTSTLPEQLPT